MNNDLLLAIKDNRVAANCIDVAAHFGNRHKHVIQGIDALMPDIGPQGFFAEITCLGRTAFGIRHDKSFDITRDGFMLLAMGFNGGRALDLKLPYIERYNARDPSLPGSRSSSGLSLHRR